MIYSNNGLQQIINANKKEKSRTYLFFLIILVISVIFAILALKFKNLFFVIIGFITSIICFFFLFYRLDIVHKNLKQQEIFYEDILFSEKSTEEVVFLSKESNIVSNGKTFCQIKAYRLKEDQNAMFLVDNNYALNMQANKNYILTLSSNIVVNYEEVKNDN